MEKRNRLRVRDALAGDEPVQLELGAGKHRMPGWLSVGLEEGADICTGLGLPLPFPESSVAQIYASHVLEHFNYTDLMRLLRECRRVLVPGGLFRVVVPDASIYIEAYSSPEGFDVDKYCRYGPARFDHSKIDWVNYIAYMGGEHGHMFDEDSLLSILDHAGFREPCLRQFDPEIDLEERRDQSIHAGAVK
jgi:predicted SAM-dependent methyltransferase